MISPDDRFVESWPDTSVGAVRLKHVEVGQRAVAAQRLHDTMVGEWADFAGYWAYLGQQR